MANGIVDKAASAIAESFEFASAVNRAWAARKASGSTTRLDGLVNEVTGFGTSLDKTTYSRFGSFAPLQDAELSALYHGNAMAARIVDALPEEALREGYHIDVGNSDANVWLTKRHTELDVRQHFVDAKRWAGAFGGAAILLGADDGRPSQSPLRLQNVRALRYLYVIDRRYLQPLTYYTDPGGGKLGQPETYRVTPLTAHGTSLSQVVHESRLLLFSGAPTGAEERARLGGWDYSVLQRPYEALIQYDTAFSAITQMLTDANQAIFKMSGLAEAIGMGEGEILKERMKGINLMRSLVRAMVIDAGNKDEPAESFERQTVSFSDIPNTLQQIIVRLAAAAKQPVSKLMGTTPTGMNASGDSDFRNWYDQVGATQHHEFTPRLRRVDEILLASAESPFRSKKFPKHEIKWPSLWKLSPLDEAQRRQANATADSAYVTAGVYLPEEVALSRSASGGADEIVITAESRKVREEAISVGLDEIVDPYASSEDADTSSEGSEVQNQGSQPAENG